MQSSRVLVTALALGLFFTLGACEDAQTKKTDASAASPPVLAVRDTFWIDVRTPGEYADGHLPEAFNIPLQEFEQRFSAQVPDQKAVVALYCRSGNRSGQALAIAQALGYGRAFNAGGFSALQSARQMH